ncbi:MAG TPA: hypothetical protein VD863_17660, partial [Bradyrhizobium sp.]|nr:hypothetical protein [Bradyrhizobium sp.]
GPAVGDHLDFYGYGDGAVLLGIPLTDIFTIMAGAEHGFAIETIRISGLPLLTGLSASDFSFH